MRSRKQSAVSSQRSVRPGPPGHRATGPLTGFTLAELLIGAAVLAIAITALLGAFMGQVTLNEHSRNLMLTTNDANRVMEKLRELNTGCTTPSAAPPTAGGFTSWNAWLADTSVNGGGGKSFQLNPTEEQMLVTCQDNTTAAACGANQLGLGEWQAPAVGSTTSSDPVRITVAVCWRHRQRTIGECTWNGAALVAADGTTPYTANAVIESPAMLSTLMTCR